MEGYFKSVVGLDHVVEGVDGEVVVDDFLLALVLLVGIFQVNIYYFLYFLATLFNLDVSLVYLVHHLSVELVILVPLKRVLVKDRLRIFPYAFLNVLA